MSRRTRYATGADASVPDGVTVPAGQDAAAILAVLSQGLPWEASPASSLRFVTLDGEYTFTFPDLVKPASVTQDVRELLLFIDGQANAASRVTFGNTLDLYGLDVATVPSARGRTLKVEDGATVTVSNVRVAAVRGVLQAL